MKKNLPLMVARGFAQSSIDWIDAMKETPDNARIVIVASENPTTAVWIGFYLKKAREWHMAAVPHARSLWKVYAWADLPTPPDRPAAAPAALRKRRVA